MTTTTSETMPTTETVMAGLKANEDWAVEYLGAMQLLDNALLASAVRGELDLNRFARAILAQRGYNADPTPKWVGFDAAAREWDADEAAARERARWPKPLRSLAQEQAEADAAWEAAQAHERLGA